MVIIHIFPFCQEWEQSRLEQQQQQRQEQQQQQRQEQQQQHQQKVEDRKKIREEKARLARLAVIQVTLLYMKASGTGPVLFYMIVWPGLRAFTLKASAQPFSGYVRRLCKSPTPRREQSVARVAFDALTPDLNTFLIESLPKHKL